MLSATCQVGRVMSEVCGVKFELCCLVEILFQLLGWFGGRFWDGISGLGVARGSILHFEVQNDYFLSS